MKRCPECRRDYYDDTLLYCLDDGSALLEGPGSGRSDPSVAAGGPFGDEPKTAILHDTGSSEAQTRAHVHTTESSPSLAGPQKAPSGAFNKRLLAIPLVLVLLAFGAYFGSRYFRGDSGRINSIAVMPFVNESGNPDVEYLSDGMTETLINTLSQLPDLSVKARSSVFSYKGKEPSPQQLGSELAVEAVLNGRVLQRGDSLILNVELVNARNGDQIWGEKYSRQLTDLTVLQTEIARDVSSKLRQKLEGPAGRAVTKSYTTNSEAYQVYLKGLFHWNKRTGDDLKKAIGYFEQANSIDPSFALAYAGLSVTYSVLPSNTFMSKAETDEANLKAKAAALRALELDDTLAEPHAVLATSKLDEWDFAEAENEYKRAIELNPNYATAHQWYSELLSRLGRHEEALASVRRAYELDPFATAVVMNMGLRYSDMGRYDEAEQYFNKTIEMSPDYPMAYWFLGEVYFQREMYDEALAMFAKGNILLKLDTPESAELRNSELRAAIKAEGTRGYWRKMLEYELEWYDMGINSPVYVASAYAELGETEKAFEWLEKAYAVRDFNLTNLGTNSRFKNVHSDPRYNDLLRRIGLIPT